MSFRRLMEQMMTKYWPALILGTAIMLIGSLFSSQIFEMLGGVVLLVWAVPFVKSKVVDDAKPSLRRVAFMAAFGAIFIAGVLGPFSQKLLEYMGVSHTFREAVVAPAVEEILKPIGVLIILGVWWKRAELRRHAKVWIPLSGAISGFSFGAMESIDKALNPAIVYHGSFWEVLRLRFFEGPVIMHVLWSLLVATAFYLWFKRGRGLPLVAPLYLGAIAMHSAWNSAHDSLPAGLFVVLITIAIISGVALWFAIKGVLRKDGKTSIRVKFEFEGRANSVRNELQFSSGLQVLDDAL